jgi:hypothetical protein
LSFQGSFDASKIAFLPNGIGIVEATSSGGLHHRLFSGHPFGVPSVTGRCI